MIAVTVDIRDPAFDQFLTETAMNEFREQQLAANIMQLLGLYQGQNFYLLFAINITFNDRVDGTFNQPYLEKARTLYCSIGCCTSLRSRRKSYNNG